MVTKFYPLKITLTLFKIINRNTVTNTYHYLSCRKERVFRFDQIFGLTHEILIGHR